MFRLLAAACIAAVLSACGPAPAPTVAPETPVAEATPQSFAVGERHLIAVSPTAALRDAGGADTVRVTVWYPAAGGAAEAPLEIGPPGQPFFVSGAAAPDDAFADGRKRPVILLSHGYGGTARMMGWLGTPLARAGYIVVAVDHPGNNGLDEMTVAGGSLFWTRVDDLRAALSAAFVDPVVGPHVDLSRVGVAGFSAGGFTALAAAGARVDVERLFAFCAENPDDGVCRPQKEFPVTMEQVRATLADPTIAKEVTRAGEDRRIHEVRAAFVMAPAIVQSLTPESMTEMTVPVGILHGEADDVAPLATNGEAAAHAIPGMDYRTLPGVGHYDFLGVCTEAGKAAVPLCTATVPQTETHAFAVEMALEVFGKILGEP